MKTLNRLKFPIFFISITLAVASCTVFDPPIVVPAYGHIDSVQFTIKGNPDTQGTASATIPAVWVYLDDNPVGAFQLPCTFPMVASNGLHSIKIYSGISAADGNSAYNINPFYQYYAVSADLQQGKTTVFKPTSFYYTWVVFKLMEDFESELVNSQPAHIKNFGGNGVVGGGSETTMSVINSPKADVFEGTHSGRAVVTHSKHYYIGMTDPPLLLPQNSTPVYMEANYKCTTTLELGMFENDTTLQLSYIILSPASTWKKIYFDMSTTISQYHVFNGYRVYFAMQLDSADGHNTDTLLLDNIKIIY